MPFYTDSQQSTLRLSSLGSVRLWAALTCAGPFGRLRSPCSHVYLFFPLCLMLSAGTLIWISLRPLLRLMICVGFGFIVTKADIFPLVAARAAAQIMLNVAMPCLMFSKIVAGITST